MNLEQARENMIKQQLRPWEVLDERVLELMAHLPRDEFVPAAWRHLAYADTEIPLGHGEVMLQPKLEGRMLQALSPRPGERVLEIGTGSGWFTALLASLGGVVHSIDRIGEFTEGARQRLSTHGFRNLRLETADLFEGFLPDGEYDVIAITGSLPSPCKPLHEALAEGGRLFEIIGTGRVMDACLVSRREGVLTCESLFETVVRPLVGAPVAAEFVL